MDAIIPNNSFSQASENEKCITLWSGDDSLAVGDYVTHGDFVAKKNIGSFSIKSFCGVYYLEKNTALTLHINNNDAYVACIFTWTNDTSASASLKTQKQINLPSDTRYASTLGKNIIKLKDGTIVALINLIDGGDYLLFITYNGTSITQTNFVKITNSVNSYGPALLRRCDDTHFVAIHERGYIDLYTVNATNIVAIKEISGLYGLASQYGFSAVVCKNGTMLITANANPSDTSCYINIASINLSSNTISKVTSYDSTNGDQFKKAYLSIIKFDENTVCFFYGYDDRYAAGYMVASVSSNGLSILSDNNNGGYFNCYGNNNAPSQVSGNQTICASSAAYIMPGGGTTTYSDTAFSFYWTEDLNPIILNYRPLIDSNGSYRSNVTNYMVIQNDGICAIFSSGTYDMTLLVMKPFHVKKATMIGSQIIGRVVEINDDGTVKIAI